MHDLQFFTKRLSTGGRWNLLNAIIVTFILTFYGLSNVQAITPVEE